MRYTRDASINAAIGFLFSELTTVESEVLRQPYPAITYPEIIPVDTSAPEGTEGIAFKTLDWAGEPAPLGDKSNDFPMVSLAAGTGLVGVHTWALGYEYSLIELKKAAALAINSRSAAIDLLVEKPLAARTATEQWMNRTAYLGDTKSGLLGAGLVNYPTVPVVGTGALIGGANQTIDQILAGTDPEVVSQTLLNLFNNAYLRVYVTQTNTNYMPTHFLVDPITLGKFSSYRIPNTTDTLLSYLERNIGKMGGSGGAGVKFVPLLQLLGAGAGGTNRMMVYTRDPQIVKLHLPMPFQLQAPETANNIIWQSAGLIRTAGTELRVPASNLYVDGL